MAEFPKLMVWVGDCVICGEPIAPHEAGEMYNPAAHDPSLTEDERLVAAEQAGLVHAQCGLDHGWEQA